MERATFSVKDASLAVTQALPSAGGASVNSSGIDLGALTGRGIRPGDVELVIEAPALTAAMLPNGTTMSYTVQQDNESTFAAAENLFTDAVVQTGAGGVGAAAAVARRRLPTDCKRYLRLNVQSGATAGDASGVSAEMSLRF